MVLIFGWGAGKAQDLGEVAPTACPNCHNQVVLHHIRSEKKISLYFIPLVPYGSNEYLACPICKFGIQITPSQTDAVKRMQAATSAFRRGAITLEGYQPQVDQFWRVVGINPAGQQVLHPTATVPSPPTEPPRAEVPSMAAQLENLGMLHAKGVLTDEEFGAAKRRVLAS